MLAVFAVAVCIRLLNVALLDSPGGFFAETDTLTYWALGTALAHRESFWPTLCSLTDRMPLYPLLLAGIQSIFGNAPRAVAVAQAILDAGTCALIAALGALIAPRVGLLAGILAAFCMTLIVLSSQVLTDTLFVFFLALGLLCTARFLLAPTSLLLAMLAGLAGGLALITRSSIALLLLGGLPLIFLGALRNTRRIGHALVAAGLFAIAAAAPAIPVLWRNLDRYHTLSLTSQTGDHLAFWIVPLVTQRADGTPYQETVHRMQALYQARLAQRALTEQPDPFVQSAVKAEIAREAMARLPLSAFVESWSEGMIVNLAAPGLLADARVRALPKPNFYATPGASLWERAKASSSIVPLFIRSCWPRASSPCCRFSCLRQSGSSCWRAASRLQQRSQPDCLPTSFCSADRWRVPNTACRSSRCCSSLRLFRSRHWQIVMCQRDAAAGRSFDALENADVVRDACATHVEDAAEVRILDLHVAGRVGELHGSERMHRYPGSADRVAFGLQPTGRIDGQAPALLSRAPPQLRARPDLPAPGPWLRIP